MMGDVRKYQQGPVLCRRHAEQAMHGTYDFEVACHPEEWADYWGRAVRCDNLAAPERVQEFLDYLAARASRLLARSRLRAAGCPMCGGSMDATTEKAVYCSRDCQTEAYNIARRSPARRGLTSQRG